MGPSLALLAAMCTGSADYFGGMASRREHPLRVVVWTQAIGLVAIVGLAGVLQQGWPSWPDLWWGGLGGVALSVALIALYRGYTVAQVGLVAPIAAVGNALVPAVWGLLNGARPSTAGTVGVVLGILAVGQLSRTGIDRDRPGARAGIALGVVAGVSFGVLFIVLSLVESGSGLWPLAASRGTAVATAAVGAVLYGQHVRGVRLSDPAMVACGVLGVLGNAAYLLATQQALLTSVVVLASLYPAATIMLARLVDKEPIAAQRLAGIGLALVAVCLIVVG